MQASHSVRLVKQVSAVLGGGHLTSEGKIAGTDDAGSADDDDDFGGFDSGGDDGGDDDADEELMGLPGPGQGSPGMGAGFMAFMTSNPPQQ